MFSLEIIKFLEGFVAAFQHLRGTYKQDGDQLITCSNNNRTGDNNNNRTGDNDCKLKQERHMPKLQ